MYSSIGGCVRSVPRYMRFNSVTICLFQISIQLIAMQIRDEKKWHYVV